ncbi:hypothetical protein Q5752_006270 [Cryptotrichosporon argae]
MPSKSVVFDVVGTCFSYDAGAEKLNELLGDKLKAHGITAKLLYYSWITSTERDYSYLSQIKQYKPFAKIMQHTFVRLLFQAGVPDPINFCTPEQVAEIIQAHHHLKPNPGLEELLSILREGGFEVFCCSDANIERVKGYFDRAQIEMPLSNILSADMCAAGKPEPAVYKMAREKVGADEPGAVSVFAAAHAWDIAAAKSAGFDTAYCTIYEYDECVDVFGKADIVTASLPELGRQIVAKFGGSS